MQITVIGTGGVGGYFGARLAKAGHKVGFVARRAHLDALRANGLRLESQLGNLYLPSVLVDEDPAAFGVPDIVLICVKLWDTEAAAQLAKPIVNSNTAVISLQNGVQKDDVLRAMLPAQAVVGGVCYVAAQIKQPGVIQHTGKLQKLIVGEYDSPSAKRMGAFGDICRQSGFEASISDDIRRSIWEKFVFLVGLSAVTTVERLPIGPIRANPSTRELLLGLMQETVAVGRARKVKLDEQFAEDRLAFCDSLPAEFTSSMCHDLEHGKRLEVEWLSGAVVTLGRTVGVPTPLNRGILERLAPHAQGH